MPRVVAQLTQSYHESFDSAVQVHYSSQCQKQRQHRFASDTEMKFSLPLTAALAFLSPDCEARQQSFLRRTLKEKDETAFQNAKIITNKTLLDNSTVIFYEPEEGIISAVLDSPPEEDDQLLPKALTKRSGVSLFLLTGRPRSGVPQELADAQTRMITLVARSLPSPTSDATSEEPVEELDGQQAITHGHNSVTVEPLNGKKTMAWADALARAYSRSLNSVLCCRAHWSVKPC